MGETLLEIEPLREHHRQAILERLAQPTAVCAGVLVPATGPCACKHAIQKLPCLRDGMERRRGNLEVDALRRMARKCRCDAARDHQWSVGSHGCAVG